MTDLRHARLISEERPQPGLTARPYVPFLRLRGRWLERAGFRVGDDVAIAVEPGRLVITPCAPRGRRPRRR